MTKMSEENKKETAKKAVETPENEEVVAATPVVEKTPVIEEVKTKKIPKKRIKKEVEAPKVDMLVETTSVAATTSSFLGVSTAFEAVSFLFSSDILSFYICILK